MHFLGIPLRKPSFNELTASAILAVGLWLACVGLLHASGHPLGRLDAGAALLISAWSCLGARVGIRLDQGSRHLAANLVVSGLLLALYEGAQRLIA